MGSNLNLRNLGAVPLLHFFIIPVIRQIDRPSDLTLFFSNTGKVSVIFLGHNDIHGLISHFSLRIKSMDAIKASTKNFFFHLFR
jgi:hypothetical protein